MLRLEQTQSRGGADTWQKETNKQAGIKRFKSSARPAEVSFSGCVCACSVLCCQAAGI